jgi:hypothetical protein
MRVRPTRWRDQATGPPRRPEAVIPGPTLIVEQNRIAEFKEVAALMPDDPVGRFGLAGAYLDPGQPEEAVLEYQETIRLKPDYSVAHRKLGRALEKVRRGEVVPRMPHRTPRRGPVSRGPGCGQAATPPGPPRDLERGWP